jgi:hypothetical protein
MAWLFVAFVVVLVLLIFMVLNRKKNPNRLRMADVGTILDRSLRSYRMNLVPLLVMSALFVPLGNISNTAASIHMLFIGIEQFVSSSPSWDVSLLLGLVWLGAVGIGKTLLACVIVRAMHYGEHGNVVRLGDKLPEKRWGAMLGLAVIMIIPSLLLNYLGIIGALVWMLFAAAPVVMFYEGIGPWSACKRSYSLVKSNASALLNTLVPLWLIGWLLIGGTLYSVLFALDTMQLISSLLASGLSLLIWLVGGVFVAPLMTLGVLQFYGMVRERELASAEQITPDVLHETIRAGARVS